MLGKLKLAESYGEVLGHQGPRNTLPSTRNA